MKILTTILLILLAVSLFFNWKGCKSVPKNIAPIINTDSIRAVVKEEIEDKAILQKLAVKSDSIQVVYRDRWHKAKEETKRLPCDSVLPIIILAGDSMAVKDSTALSDCKKVNRVNDSIISHLQLWIKADSVNYSALQDTVKVRDAKIKKLKRKVFWANFRTALVWIGWVTRESVSLGTH